MVLALALMSLVFLLVVALVSLVGTDLSLAELRKQRVLSQANAKMGMMVALGELQKHLGPDTRISGTADLMDERIEPTGQFLDTPYDPTRTPADGIDLNENGRIDQLPFGQRYWTGVWKHRASNDGSTPGISPTPKNLETGNVGNRETMYDTDYDPHPDVEVAWLVSGNEGHQRKLGFFSSGGIFQSLRNMVGVPDGILAADRSAPYGSDDNAWLDYEKVVTTDAFFGESRPFLERTYSHPLIGLPDPDDPLDPDSNETVWILKRPLLLDSYDESNPQDWRNHLAGEPIKVRKTSFPLSEKEEKIGVYAYWVGDEGVKTKVNLVKEEGDSPRVAQEPLMDLSSGEKESGFDLPFDGSIRGKEAVLDVPSYASMDAQAQASALAAAQRADKAAVNYHALTADSFGVLADVRTGGLKRDLSAAFSMSDSQFDADGFGGWIFQERVHYMKNFEPNLNNSRNGPKANEWLDQEGTDFIFDEGVLAAGPKWSVLRDFYNSYEYVDSSGRLSLGGSAGAQLSPDKFPRAIGDNTVIFDGRPNGKIRQKRQSEISKQYNYFSEMRFRPEPSNHPYSPVLLEVKYAHEPYFRNGRLGLAVYPSVALWNPYDVTLSMNNDLILEIPLEVEIQGYNTKDWDIMRRWRLHHWPRNTVITTPSGTSQPATSIDFSFDEDSLLANRQPWINPPPWGGGGGPYLDLNGNGRRDPGEPMHHAPSIPQVRPPRPPGGGGGGGPRPHWHHFAYRRHHFFHQNFNRVSHQDYNVNFYTFRQTFPFAHASSIATGRVPNFHIFHGPRNLSSGTKGVPLRLRIRNMQLQPGEKGHYVLTSMPTPMPWNAPVKELVLGKGNEGALNYAGFVTDYQSEPNEPISIRFRVEKIRGVKRGEMENFDGDGNLMPPASGIPSPSGISLYEVRTQPHPSGSGYEWPIRRINKEFGLQIGSGTRDYRAAAELDIDLKQAGVPSNRMYGNGFRIRYQLPGQADKVVFQQYNPRALMDSYQAGSGDNWVIEKYNGATYQNNHGAVNGNARFFDVPADDEPFDETKHFLPRSPNLRNAVSSPIMPRVDTVNQGCVGLYHDYVNYDGKVQAGARGAILFGVPREPMLSMIDFRHANLNYYLQSSAYQVGNSYASTQLGRYKTWGRVRRIDFQPHSDMNPGAQDSKFTFMVPTPYGDVTVRLFPWDLRNWNFELGTVRSTNSEFNHQNVVLDQNFYLNQALFDGYFLSGDNRPGAIGVEPSNPRFVEYYRQERSDQPMDSSSPSSPSYQTNAGDLLVDGAFNVNSTSVEAWISQLTSLKELGAAKTYFPRTFTEPVNKDDLLAGWASLTDEQVALLATKIVEEVKLRGPFLSFSDFVNRRLARMTFPSGNISLAWLPKEQWPRETRDTVLGLRGPVQAAIAKAKINNEGFTASTNLALPTVPTRRWNGAANNFTFIGGEFGAHAVSLQNTSRPRMANPNVWRPIPNNRNHWFRFPQSWGSGVEQVDRFVPDPANQIRATDGHVQQGFANSVGQLIGSPPYMIPEGTTRGRPGTGSWVNARAHVRMESYTNAFEHGEAPDAILGVENVASAAQIPGWLTQSDVLSPLAPVLSARSDTFTIRVMGESPASEDNPISSRSWIEVTVQRVPDYVKASLDAPHHRPHEPFEDRNFDGIWNGRDEYWLDLNQNSRESQSGRLVDVSNGIESGPDLPGVGDTQAYSLYAVGLATDRKLNEDKHEEVLSNPGKDVSRKGINQRFGRKFKIIKFRWLRENEV